MNLQHPEHATAAGLQQRHPNHPQGALSLQAAARRQRFLTNRGGICGAARQVSCCNLRCSEMQCKPLCASRYPRRISTSGTRVQSRLQTIFSLTSLCLGPWMRRYPWMASLRYNDGSGALRCGGAPAAALCPCQPGAASCSRTHPKCSQVLYRLAAGDSMRPMGCAPAAAYAGSLIHPRIVLTAAHVS